LISKDALDINIAENGHNPIVIQVVVVSFANFKKCSFSGFCKVCHENEKLNADSKLKPFGLVNQVRNHFGFQLSSSNFPQKLPTVCN
jgi:hypothetical protein